MYNVRDVSELMDIPEASVCRYIRIGRIEAFKVNTDWIIKDKEYERLSKVNQFDRRYAATEGGRWNG